jgi:hypothetical protein
MRVLIRRAGLRPVLSILGAAALVAVGCGLDKVEQPAAVGPAETGVSAQLTAAPDTLNADGVSQSAIQLVLRDSSGQPVAGRAVLFCTTPTIDPQNCAPYGNGALVPATGSTYVGPIQTGIVMATDKNGVANVVWVAGTSTDTITIGVRSYGIDAATGFLRTTKIFQQ